MKKDSLNIEKDKFLLRIENFISISTLIAYLILVLIISFINLEEYVKVVLIMILTIYLIAIAFIMLKIEQIVGYYRCKKCNHKHTPTYLNILLAMHVGRTRYMKCPKCNENSWQKKVLE